MSTPVTVTVNILDKEYRISCTEDERLSLETSAQYLDNKMSEIRKSGRIVGLDRIAVMAGLNITHDLITEGGEKDGLNLDLTGKINALSNKVEFALNNFTK
ncbi:MAG: Z-ring-associated protein ZapA [Cycloclasticus sp. symbiont of Poecilosclerida sp. M]|nr:MAG: Z-ring-associated protein ZapA [Cycloclasticus sp. symbiont of Poecilosclerida sp. M]